MKRPIVHSQAENTALFGLEVRIDFAWLGQTLTRDDRGITHSLALQTPSEVVL